MLRLFGLIWVDGRLLQLACIFNLDDFGFACLIIWCIWTERNACVHVKRFKSPDDGIISYARFLFKEYKDVHALLALQLPPARVINTALCLPSLNRLKLNVDVALGSSGVVGLLSAVAQAGFSLHKVESDSLLAIQYINNLSKSAVADPLISDVICLASSMGGLSFVHTPRTGNVVPNIIIELIMIIQSIN
ncbi:hypothetical protein ACOSP7_025171 [Xanthoceras sorbifolium]